MRPRAAELADDLNGQGTVHPTSRPTIHPSERPNTLSIKLGQVSASRLSSRDHPRVEIAAIDTAVVAPAAWSELGRPRTPSPPRSWVAGPASRDSSDAASRGCHASRVAPKYKIILKEEKILFLHVRRTIVHHKIGGFSPPRSLTLKLPTAVFRKEAAALTRLRLRAKIMNMGYRLFYGTI